MKAPAFWEDKSPTARAVRAALAPMSAAYAGAGRVREAFATAHRAGAPVLCVGSVCVGGSGKTPCALALAEALTARDRRPALLCRGHGGRLRGPLRVDPTRHDAADVGDEALLLSRAAPTYAARRRDRAARLAVADGADILIMDDGLTHPHLHTDRTLLVTHGGENLAGAKVLPAGPLRLSLRAALARTHAVLVEGDGPIDPALDGFADRGALFRARLEAEGPPPPGPLVAFAGIARPERFFASVEADGADVREALAFPDHHPFTPRDLARLRARAQAHGARLVTTAKDHVRLPESFQGDVLMRAARLKIAEEDRLLELLTRGLF